MRKFIAYLTLFACFGLLFFFGTQSNTAKSGPVAASILTDSPFVQNVVHDLTRREFSVSLLELRQASAEELTQAEVIISTRTPPLSTTTPTLNLQAALPGQYALPWLTPQGAGNSVRTIDQFLRQELSGYRSRETENILSDLETLEEEYNTTLAECSQSILVTTLPDLDSLSFEYDLAILHLGTNDIDTTYNEQYLQQNELEHILFSTRVDNGQFQKFLTSPNYESLPFETLEFVDSPHYLSGLRKNLGQLSLALECVPRE